MLKEGKLVENLKVGYSDDATPPLDGSSTSPDDIGNLLVYYHWFETDRCFLKYSRDFVVLQYARAVRTGLRGRSGTKFVVVGASIEHQDCPVNPEVVRADINLFGWVIEELPGKSLRSKVTYMIHIDFGGEVPPQLLNTISFRQPLCIHYLRLHMMKEIEIERKEKKRLLKEEEERKGQGAKKEEEERKGQGAKKEETDLGVAEDDLKQEEEPEKK